MMVHLAQENRIAAARWQLRIMFLAGNRDYVLCSFLLNQTPNFIEQFGVDFS